MTFLKTLYCVCSGFVFPPLSRLPRPHRDFPLGWLGVATLIYESVWGGGWAVGFGLWAVGSQLGVGGYHLHSVGPTERSQRPIIKTSAWWVLHASCSEWQHPEASRAVLNYHFNAAQCRWLMWYDADADADTVFRGSSQNVNASSWGQAFFLLTSFWHFVYRFRFKAIK